MLSSHQTSSWGVSLQPVPYSKYDLVTSSNCQVEPIQRIRILLPRKLSRLNRVCVQTPLPDGSTTPSPHEQACVVLAPATLPQCDQLGPTFKHIVSGTVRAAGGSVPASVGVNSQYCGAKVL